MRIRFFRTQLPKAFDYKPRYYDEEKEKREERKRIMDGVELSKEERKAAIREGFSRHRSSRQPAGTYSVFRMIMIVISLLLITYYILS
jgi:hypothetical protein